MLSEEFSMLIVVHTAVGGKVCLQGRQDFFAGLGL